MRFKIISLISTVYNLGFLSVFSVLVYRLKKKFSLINLHTKHYNYNFKEEFLINKNFNFKNIKLSNLDFSEYKIFGHITRELNKEINWHENIIDNKFIRNDIIWYKIPHFSKKTGDIKLYWDISRFTWLPVLATKIILNYNVTQNKNLLQDLLNSWVKSNPVYFGVNWVCGQECSFRLMNISLAQLIFNNFSINNNLLMFYDGHLRRIYNTFSYAIAQNNNHSISEASALFICGSILNHNNIKGVKYSNKGRKNLENLVDKLILNDGTFSQYSTNYHRLMLDTLCFVEIIRRKLKLPKFSDMFYFKLNKATNWLFQFINLNTGKVPNLGGNDGSNFFLCFNKDVNNYLFSVELSAAVFLNSNVNHKLTNKLYFEILNIKKCDNLIKQNELNLFIDGGFNLINYPEAKVLFRFPNFVFRPSQSDILHIDLFIDNNNFLPDSGSYSYTDNSHDQLYDLSESFGHNTVSFDDLSQMKKYSKFLYINWPKYNFLHTNKFKKQYLYFGSGYTHFNGSVHNRIVKSKKNELIVIDLLRGIKKHADLKWRVNLENLSYTVKNNKLVFESKENLNKKMEIFINNKNYTVNLIDGFVSKKYSEKSKIKILNIRLAARNIRVKSTFSW